MSEATQATFFLKTEYSTPYGALIREDIVMGISRYFIERWLPVLGTGPATLVNTLRQLDYRCHEGAVTISGEALAREASMSRRNLYTCLETPWLKAFIRLESGQRMHDEAGKIVQQSNRYFIRMDDPLTPADANHLLDVLNNLADTPLEAARRALTIDARELWATSPTESNSDRFPTPRPITAQDVLMRAFPSWKPVSDEEKQDLATLAESLQRHVTLTREDGRISKIIVPQYFRKRWWKYLGHDLAWTYLWLRGFVYDNVEDGVRRNTCWIPSQNALLAIIGRPREWWRRNVENAKSSTGDAWGVTDFFQQLDSQKGRDPAHPQWVARQFSVTLDIPIAPEDRGQYAEMRRTWQDKPLVPISPSSITNPHKDIDNIGSATLEHTGSEGVRHIDAHRLDEGLPHWNTPERGGSATLEHTGTGGVCHIGTQGSATSAHRESVLIIEAPESENQNSNSSKDAAAPPPEIPHMSTENAVAAANSQPLIDQIAECLEKKPETPLFCCAGPLTWLQDTWPDPVRPHTPAWTLVTDGRISPRDLVALILAIWADASIKHPPRYLSWLVQRWQTLPEAPPIDRWDRWCALADLSIGDWLEQGRREWIELAPQDNRALPFGLDILAAENGAESSTASTWLAHLPNQPDYDRPVFLPPTSEPASSSLDEKPGSGNLTVREIWIATLGQLSAQLNRSTYVDWVEGARAVSYADGVLTVRARHIMARDMLSERLNFSIEETVSNLAKRPITVRYIVDPPYRLPPEPPQPD